MDDNRKTDGNKQSENVKTEAARKTTAERLSEITDRLEKGLENLFNSDTYCNYLNTMAKFHDYSFNNTLLIAMQKPDATYVAGFDTWKNKFERHVNKGEKGIKIIAPMPYKLKVMEEVKDPKTGSTVLDTEGKPKMHEVEKTIPNFQPVTVFDISQTWGKELPQLGVSELTGKVEGYKDLITALEKVSPVPVERKEIASGAKGYFNPTEQKIALQQGMSEAQEIKTLIHEISHSLVDDKYHVRLDGYDDNEKRSRSTKEVTAESVAYSVSQHFNIDTSDYSFGYIAGWSAGKDMKELKESMDLIRRTASKIINDVEQEMYVMQKERTAEAEKEAAGQEKTAGTEKAAAGNEMAAGTKGAPEQEMTDLADRNHMEESMEDGKEGTDRAEPEIRLHDERNGMDAAEKTAVIYEIWQLESIEENRGIIYESYDMLAENGEKVDPNRYSLKYSAELQPGEDLDSLYEKFNVKRPEDFRGHSLSVSDIIVMKGAENAAAYYVDSFGFREVPEFLLEQGQEKTEQTQKETVQAGEKKNAGIQNPGNERENAPLPKAENEKADTLLEAQPATETKPEKTAAAPKTARKTSKSEKGDGNTEKPRKSLKAALESKKKEVAKTAAAKSQEKSAERPKGNTEISGREEL